jgi:hypothetical protein
MRLLPVIASALLGLATIPAQAGDAPVSMAGKWSTDFGLAELTENGDSVTGSYAVENGRITGTRAGNRLTGQWTQSTSGRKCDTAVNGSHHHGRFVFDFSADAFTGKWSYCDDAPADTWSGKRDGSSTAAAQPAPASSRCAGECPPWVARSLTGTYLPLAGQVDTWSDAKPFQRKSGLVIVQSRFMGQQGTTCKFEVYFSNPGSKPVNESIIIARPGKAAVSQYDFSLDAELAPGTNVTYGTEVRECPVNWGKTQDMTKCAACEPMVYFIAK